MGMNRGALNERIPHQGLWSPGEDGWMGTQAEDGPAFLANIREAKGRHTSRIWWLDFRYFPFKCPFLFNVLIGVWLLYTVLLVSAVQRSESAIIVVVFSCSVVMENWHQRNFLEKNYFKGLCPQDKHTKKKKKRLCKRTLWELWREKYCDAIYKFTSPSRSHLDAYRLLSPTNYWLLLQYYDHMWQQIWDINKPTKHN